jgi:hypothetical protein
MKAENYLIILKSDMKKLLNAFPLENGAKAYRMLNKAGVLKIYTDLQDALKEDGE